MQVFENRIKVYLLQDIQLEDAQRVLTGFIDYALGRREEWLGFHKKRMYKNYCFDLLYPQAENKIYQKDKIYCFTIRTIDPKLAEFFSSKLVNESNNNLKALTCESKILPVRTIDRIYSLTACVLKDDTGYWRSSLTLEDFERRLKENLIKKYTDFTGEKIEEDFDLYREIEFKNRKPVLIRYKTIHLLGDKLNLQISSNEQAQKLAYMALGTGILENNARGAGFMNYQWVKP